MQWIMTISGIWKIPGSVLLTEGWLQQESAESSLSSPTSPKILKEPCTNSQFQWSMRCWKASVRVLNYMGQQNGLILLSVMANPPVVDLLLNKWSISTSQVTGSFCPLPTHSCTFAGDDTSPCDWGADESKLVSALQGAICGWRNPGWDW